ncbi:MAG: alpha/beta hydrolase [Microthrixaceae bacterium]
MDRPERVTAALEYYRQTVQPERQLPELASAQSAVFEIPSQPLLYLHGRNDGCLHPMLADVAAEHLSPPSRVQLVDDAGHFLHLERPAQVNRLVVDFLTES